VTPVKATRERNERLVILTTNIIILAEARKTSQILRGEGDGLRNKIFAEAFGRDPEFFSFYRAMQSYEKSLINGSETSLVLSPDSEFFRYFGESGLNKILKR